MVDKAFAPDSDDGNASWEQVDRKIDNTFGDDDTIMHIKIKGQTVERADGDVTAKIYFCEKSCTRRRKQTQPLNLLMATMRLQQKRL